MNSTSSFALGRVYPLVIPSQFGDTALGLAGGAGTPRMVYDPEAGSWLLFFTGWKNANLREVYVAEANRDMTLSGIKKILPSPPTRDAVNVIYDPWNDGFILLTTEGGPLCIRHLDRQFQERASKKIMEGMQDSGAGMLTIMGNYSEENPNAAMFYPKGNTVVWRLVNRIDNLEDMKLGDEMVFSDWEDSNDVIDAFRVNDKFGVLVEYFTDKQNWRSRVAMCGNCLAPNIRALSASLPVPFTDGHANFGHPSFTAGPDGKPKIMFSLFMSHTPPFKVIDYSKQWRHEIWAWELGPDVFDLKTYGRMHDRLAFDEKTTRNPPVYDLLDAKKVILQVSGPRGKAGRVKIEEATSLRAHVEGSHSQQQSVKLIGGKYVIESPLRTLRVKADKGSVVWLTAEY